MNQGTISWYGTTFDTTKVIAQPGIVRKKLNLLLTARAIAALAEVKVVWQQSLQDFSLNLSFQFGDHQVPSFAVEPEPAALS